MKYFKHVCVLTLCLFFSVGIYGQTLEQVIESYKKAAETGKTNPAAGIQGFEQTIEMATKVGTTADTQRKQAEEALVTLYMNTAKKSIQSKKYAQAYTELGTVSTVAQKYKNTTIKAEADRLLPTVELYAGVEAYQGGNTDNAIQFFDKVIARNSSTATQAMYYKGLTYQKKKDDANAITTFLAALEKAKATNDTKWQANTEKKLGTFYFNKGVEAKQGNKTDAALQNFQSALKYDQKNADIFYQLANISNTKSKWVDAMTYANQGVALITTEADKFGFYYEIGLALAGQGKATEACTSFKKVTSGTYLESAKYQIEQVLKCQ